MYMRPPLAHCSKPMRCGSSTFHFPFVDKTSRQSSAVAGACDKSFADRNRTRVIGNNNFGQNIEKLSKDGPINDTLPAGNKTVLSLQAFRQYIKLNILLSIKYSSKISNMRQSIGSSIVLLAFVALASAQVPFAGRCPKVHPVETFDLSGYLGLWYQYAAYPFVFEFGNKCVTATYGLGENGTVSVLNAALDRKGEPTGISGFAKVAGVGQLEVTFPPQPEADRVNYIVLYTDYKNLSVVYSCAEFGLINVKFVWVLTRERHPSQDIINKAYSVLEANKIKTDVLEHTDQKNCGK